MSCMCLVVFAVTKYTVHSVRCITQYVRADYLVQLVDQCTVCSRQISNCLL